MTWSGMTIGPPGAFSWHAARAGNTAAMRSSASMRCTGRGFFLPPRKRRMASDRFRFQRQREANMGEASTAWRSTASAVSDRSRREALSRGKLCWGPSDSTTASSLAAACSSKSKVAQKRLRRARPNARLTRPPKGACTTSCMPPASSKNRSNTMWSRVGRTPSSPRAAVRYCASCSAASVPMPHACSRWRVAASVPGAGSAVTMPATARRSSDTSSESSSVRLGASPTQNGMVGWAPSASVTRTSPWVTRRTRHEWVPRRNTSPTIDSMAKSSLTVPTGVSSGSATTR